MKAAGAGFFYFFFFSGKRSAVSPLQGDTGDRVASQGRYAGFLTLLQWLVVDILAN